MVDPACARRHLAVGVGRPAIHIGASALVYGWFFFLVGVALFHRSALAVVGMAVALGLFGGLLWVFESGPGISWEGHVCGAVAGTATAWWVSKRGGFRAEAQYSGTQGRSGNS